MAERSSGTKQAGAFDIRVFIGALLGIYGVIRFQNIPRMKVANSGALKKPNSVWR